MAGGLDRCIDLLLDGQLLLGGPCHWGDLGELTGLVETKVMIESVHCLDRYNYIYSIRGIYIYIYMYIYVAVNSDY